MATIAVIHGGGDSASSWGPVLLQLRELDHTPVAINLPCEDPNASWPEYADAVAASVRNKSNIVVVAHSLGGFTAPLVCERVAVQQLILVAAMIPTPGAIAGNYWRDAGYGTLEFDDETFYHDLSPEARTLAKRAERGQADKPMSDPWPLPAWPRVRTRFILGRNDRVLPAAVTRRIVRERLAIEADEMDTGHCVYLAKPVELAQRIHAYVGAPQR
jgi:pimeloyl-ACP methyl ester carboxylesterase